jgi:signal transduction histidine kinase
LKRQQLYYEKELAIEKERKRISADIHDELGASLSGITLMAEMTGQKYKMEGIIEDDLDHIHSSLSTLSHKMREVIWSLNSENDTLENLLGYINRRGREMFVHSTIHFRSKLPNRIIHLELKGEERKNIYLAVMEAMHNALKHSQASLVELKLTIVSNKLIVIIEDDGKGFDTSKQQDGNGLNNMQQRLFKVNGSLNIQNNRGIRVSMEIPLAQ